VQPSVAELDSVALRSTIDAWPNRRSRNDVDEICERPPDEWVALVEIDWVNDTDFDFRSARVIGHGSRREQYEQARRWRSRYVSMGHF
jgi:hypothetical protein